MSAFQGTDLNQVSSQHDTLLDLLRDLEAEPGLERELELVTELQSMLVEHFDLEERPGGFFARTLADSPLAGTTIDRLVHEHQRIRDDATALLESMQACMEGPVARARAEVRRLAAQLREHEAAESALLVDTLYQDIGGSD